MPTFHQTPQALTPDEIAVRRIGALADGLSGLTILSCLLAGAALIVCLSVIVLNFILIFLTAPLGIKDIPPPLGVGETLAEAYIWIVLATFVALCVIASAL
jgi:hypothetical protein